MIEEEFFKAFGLKPYYLYYVFDLQGRKNEYCFKKEEFIDFVKKDKKYLLLKVEKRTPEITAEKLLQMICIYAQREVFCFPVVPNNEETWTISLIKKNILEQLMYLGKYSDDKEIVKQQIRKLFEE